MFSKRKDRSAQGQNAEERDANGPYDTVAMYDNIFALTECEMWWRDRYQTLLSHGYELRPRLRPGWIPSWKTNKKLRGHSEDTIVNLNTETCDATRLSDSTTVMIKRVRKRRNEKQYNQHFCSAERASSADNHCVPIYDFFSDEIDPNMEFIIMPLLRPFDEPPMTAVTEAVDFVHQTLSGLAFMHREGVVHLDCSIGNIMMDATSMYPKGFHPIDMESNKQGTGSAKRKRGIRSKSVKYYFIDFGLSQFMDRGFETLAFGGDGADQEVPELESRVPYLATPVDVFILGNVYRKTLLEKYSNLEFLRGLVDKMTRQKPEERPTAADALAEFESLPIPKWGPSLRWRLQDRLETKWGQVLYDTSAYIREGVYQVESLLTAPFEIGRYLVLRTSRSTR